MKQSCCRSEHKFEQGFPQQEQSPLRGGQEKWLRSDEAGLFWGWIQPKITLSYFETILRQNLLFSVAVLISMLDVSCDSVSSYIWTSGEILNKITYS